MQKIILVTLLFTLNAYAEPSDEHLERVFAADEFRIIYSLKGKHALTEDNLIDNNRNNTPDFIENLALKLKTARTRYLQQFNLQHPLNSKRYQGKASYIDVTILALDGNGSTGDEIINASYPEIAKTKTPVLSIKILNSLAWGNHTPEHELFHLFQNGYSMFKNRWYTEGSARWSEQAFLPEAEERGVLPANDAEFKLLVNASYGAKLFWNRITYLCDASSPANDPNLTTSPTIYGVLWIKTFLENLGQESDTATQERHLPVYRWPEAEQKNNPANNKHLFNAIKQTVHTQCPKTQLQSPEFIAFLEELDKQISAFKE